MLIEKSTFECKISLILCSSSNETFDFGVNDCDVDVKSFWVQWTPQRAVAGRGIQVGAESELAFEVYNYRDPDAVWALAEQLKIRVGTGSGSITMRTTCGG
jgi:hypothetical protein